MFINFYYIKSIHSEEEYVGSTEFEKEIRFKGHKDNNKAYNRGSKHSSNCGSFKLLGLGDCTIHLIGTTFCHTDEIRKRHEQYCMDIHPKKLTNILRAFTSPELKREMHLVANRNWNLDNHERQTTEIDCECGLSYQFTSEARHFKSNTHRDYHGLERLPPRLVKKQTCICGAKVNNIKRHMDSPKHKKAMLLKNNSN